jgi:predicted transcriptional regulator
MLASGAIKALWYNATMTAKVLKEVLERVETWPQEAQEELAAIAREIDAGLTGGSYRASREELAGIDRGLKAADEGRFATEADIEAVLAKHRRA